MKAKATITANTENSITINEYDGLNQLVKVTEGSNTYSYTHNWDGLRASKTVNGVTTNHIWDGDQMVLEIDGAGNVSNKYIRGINLIYAEESANRRYFLYNGHGDTVQLTSTTGSSIKVYDYDAFGNEKNIDPNDTNLFRYCGEYFDKETGTIYLRARYYDPGIGRFITEDSYWGKDSDPLSLNLYTYCYSDPIMYSDPSGNIPVETILDVLSIGWSFSDFVRNPSWANFGYLAWDVAATIVPYAPGSYTAKGIKAGTKILSRADEYTKTGVWAMKAFDRGWEIEKALGGWGNNFPVIDWAIKEFRNGKGYLSDIKSIKSIDITAKTYQKSSNLKSLLKGYVNDLANFSEAKFEKVNYYVMDGTSRTLEIAIPAVEMTADQAKVFKYITDYAKSEKNINVVVKIIK
ncbi:RHS repeat-associated core domain-containing protein [Ruminiclostridium hungatei]|uniref:RHS repeat-associated core domain-containing protein n=1 Tax=Ruminiclostridium hungatei TaxID=48256 RepID=UPI0009ACB603|nr:RHS repeat-associated core domain-containing protein [Ruminiclostridium hungatei]